MLRYDTGHEAWRISIDDLPTNMSIRYIKPPVLSNMAMRITAETIRNGGWNNDLQDSAPDIVYIYNIYIYKLVYKPHELVRRIYNRP